MKISVPGTFLLNKNGLVKSVYVGLIGMRGWRRGQRWSG